MTRLRALAVLVFVSVLVAPRLSGQSAEPDPRASVEVGAASPLQPAHARPNGSRPAVGLALSGGGALGLAHIGVLRYFEEHHIPVDALAGTSMGGLVGGFYATGMDAKQLTDIAEHANWDVLLSPTPQFRDQPIVEKQSWNQSFGNVTLRLGHHFSLPQGINSGEALSLLLSRNTVAYGGVLSFDELPTRFRCVATDLVSANAVVLERGSLARAMRATMALPAVFTPVPWDDKLLVDGGLVQNLPVEVVKDMGVQKTIAVALKTGNPKAADLSSLTSIALRSISVAIEQNERRSAALADAVIVVDTKRFTGLDYARASDIIRAGYEAAQASAEQLEPFEVSAESWQEYVAERARKARHAPHAGPLVDVAAASASFEKNAEEELARKLGPGPVTEAQLEDTLSGMVAATGVPGASYQWSQRDNGYRVEFVGRTGESILIRPSFAFGISGGEPSQAALRLSISRIGQTAYKSRTLASANIGYDPGLKLEYYHPVEGTGYFFAPGFVVQRTNFNSYDGSVRSTVVRDRFGVSFYGGIGTWRFAQLRVGLLTGYDSYGKALLTDGVPAQSEGFANPEVTWIYNTLDSGGLPHSGTKVEGAAGYSFRGRSHPYLRNAMTNFIPATKRVSLLGTGQVATSFGEKLSFYEQFTSGGAGQLTAYRYQEFHANTLVTGGAGVVFYAPPVRRLAVSPGLMALYEVGRLDLGSAGWQTHQSVTTGVFVPTPIGAAGVAISFNERGKARVRLSLGALGKR